jgi:hypothetical protein
MVGKYLHTASSITISVNIFSTQNHWFIGPRSSSSVKEIRKHKFSETGAVSDLR